MLVFGHRGTKGHALDNTIESFKKALELGVDYIEFDVRSTKDDQAVVFHDPKLNKLTDSNYFISQITLKDLKKIKLQNNQKILTLQEAITFINKKARMNIHVKKGSKTTPIVKVINNFLAKGWNKDLFIVSSFDPKILKEIKTQIPEVNIGLLEYLPYVNSLRSRNLKLYSIHSYYKFMTKWYADKIHKKGLKCIAFTVNEKKDIERMKKLGVDGIITDFPDRVKRD